MTSKSWYLEERFHRQKKLPVSGSQLVTRDERKKAGRGP